MQSKSDGCSSPPPPPKPRRKEDRFRSAHQRFKRTGPGRVNEAVDFSAAAAIHCRRRRPRLTPRRDSGVECGQCGRSAGNNRGGDILDPLVVVVERNGSAPPNEGDGQDGSVAGAPSPATYRGPVFGLSTHPGFLFFPGALSPSLQIELARSALGKYCELPLGRTNIELVPPKSHEIDDKEGGMGMWELWKEQNGLGSASEFDPHGAELIGAVPLAGVEVGSVREPPPKENRPAASAKGEIAKRDGGKNDRRPHRRLDKLSWSTLGYHYDWTARAYREESRSKMPAELQNLGEIFASLGNECCGNEAENGAEKHNRECIPRFRAQAAIVNYYTPKSVMGGHRDDLEMDFSRPVISLSLGLPAIFLLGGKTRDDTSTPVVPILVRAGDVMIMGGESRLCYHGVARVFKPEAITGGKGDAAVTSSRVERWAGAMVEQEVIRSIAVALGTEELDGLEEERDRAATRAYLLDHRINVNLRQVLPDGIERIPQ